MAGGQLPLMKLDTGRQQLQRSTEPSGPCIKMSRPRATPTTKAAIAKTGRNLGIS